MEPSVLFLCTGNSCRSQMAEGWARALKSAEFRAYSAGTAPHGLNPLAVRAMGEVGIDITSHTSDTIEMVKEREPGLTLDHVVTVCGHAHEHCPVFPAGDGTTVVHRGFDDPPKLAEGAANDDEAMVHYRRVRDEIRDWVRTLPGALGE